MSRKLLRAWPWLIGIAIVVVVALRVPVDEFRRSLAQGPHLTLFVVDTLVVIALLATDTLATWVVLLMTRTRWALSKVLAIRGVTYLLALINYAVGQGGIGFYLHREGVPGLRATGITLFMIGTTFATLVLTTGALWLASDAPTEPTMLWTLIITCIGLALYLAIIAIAPALLVRREVLKPLFETGVRGHALAMAARVPHVAIIIVGHWLAMIAWGFPAPFAYSMRVLPVVVLVAVLPISPAGLGTTQAALVYFFSDFAPGATEDARAANVLAFGIAHFVYATVAQLAAGAACVPFARRIRAAPATQTPDPRDT